jgi:glycosyltransferase involved in cell wall biosynthesis
MYPPQHSGGYELVFQAATRRARESGHEVRVLTSDYRARSSAEEDPDVHRTLRWYWDPARYEFRVLGMAGRAGLERHNATELRRHLSEFSPDVVAWWSMGCMSLSLIEQVRRAGIPAVFFVHDDWLVYGPKRDAWIRIWRDHRRMVAPLAERVVGVPTRVGLEDAGTFVFNSRYTRDRARQAGVQPRSASIVYPGIDDTLLHPLREHEWGWRLGYVGRIDRAKGVDTAVTALSHLPSTASLTIWGSGDDEYVAEMRQMAAQAGVDDRVRFAGFVSGTELLDAYGACDVVLFPARWEEPFGLVPIEAMAVGRPVVATSRGGTAEFLRDGENALVVEPDEPDAFARCVERLAGDPALRGHLRTGGQRTAREFTIDRFADAAVREMVLALR